MGKKVYGKKGKSIHFPLFPYTFFPIFPHGKKWENTHFSMGKNGVGPPPITKRVVILRGSCFCEKYSKKSWDIKTALVYHFFCLPLLLFTTSSVYHFFCLPLLLFTTSSVYHFFCLPLLLFTTSLVYHFFCLPLL